MQKSVKEDRDKYIGGSDIPIIMGISSFKSRFDLLLEKAGLKKDDFDGNEYTEYGNIMEEKIRNYMNELDNTEYKEDKLIKDDIRCHVDGYNGNLIIEIKTTSNIHDNVDDYKVYLVQLLFYMYNYNIKSGKLCVYQRPENFSENFDKERLKIYDIELDKYNDLVDKIKQSVDQFRNDLKKVKDNPFITEEELLPIDLTELSNKVIALENKLQEYKVIEEEQKNLKEKLKQAMISSGNKGWETPNGVKITLVEDGEDKEIMKFNENKFKNENEELYKEYLEPKIQKGKAGYVRITFPKD